jgi:excisionase family DNA binding protein
MSTTDIAKPKGPVWFSIREAAEYLGIGEPTLYRWMRDGKINVRKVGDSTRFLQEDLDAVIRLIPADKNVDAVREFCPACHGTELAEGDVRSTGLVYFKPKKTKFWTLKESLIPVSARMCLRCGSVFMTGDVAKLNALRAPEAPAPAEPAEGGKG